MNEEKICCPEFDPAPWDGRTFAAISLFFIIICFQLWQWQNIGNTTNAFAAPINSNQKTPICHATASADNPYIFLEVTPSSIDGTGANDHTLHPGDIIPITDLDSNGIINVSDCNYSVAQPPTVKDADLSLRKTADKNVVRSGETVIFNLSISNLAGISVSEVSVTDMIPSQFSYQSHVAQFGNFSLSTGIWNIGTIGGNNTVGLAITVKVNDSANNGTVINSASITSASKNDPVSSNNSASVTLQIQNPAPIAHDDSYSVFEDAVLNISAPGLLENDENTFQPGIIITALSNPGHGSLIVNDNGSFTYTPQENYFGADSFTYRICANAFCDNGLVNINIEPVNDAPEISNDFASTIQNTSVVINVLHDDVDAENNINPDSVSIVSAPSHGTAVANSDGTITYTPNQDYVGSDTFTYTVCDILNACSQAEATVTVQTTEGGVASITIGSDSATTNEDAPITINILNNDIYTGSGILYIHSITSDASHGAVSITGSEIIYTPNADYFGEDSFIYLACDNATPQICAESPPVSVIITPVNDSPVANDDIVSVGKNDSVVIHASHDDYDIDDNLNSSSITIVTQPAIGSATVTGGDTITYTPNAGVVGADSITYRICDFSDACDTATITINIIPPSDSPVTTNDSLFVFANGSGNVDVLANDTSSVGELHIGEILSAPAYGTAVINQDNTITYTPLEGFIGQDSFTYTACDSKNHCSSGIVSVAISEENTPPVADQDFASTIQNTSVVINVLHDDIDAENNINPDSVSIVSAPSHGTAVANSDGTITYTPNQDYVGSDTFTYTVCDILNACSQAEATVTVQTTEGGGGGGGNTSLSLTAVNDDFGIHKNASSSFDILQNDSPAGSIFVSKITTQPLHGTAMASTTSITYVPQTEFLGTDHFSYLVCRIDSPQTCADAMVAIQVYDINTAPVGKDDLATTHGNEQVALYVLANDTDNEHNINVDSLTVPILPAHGTVVVNKVNGAITYSAAAGFVGTDFFSYAVCDNENMCATAVVYIKVLDTSYSPTAEDLDSAETTYINMPKTISVPFSPELEIIKMHVSSHHSAITLNNNGTFLYVPKPGYYGADSFSYVICDKNKPTACKENAISIVVLNEQEKTSQEQCQPYLLEYIKFGAKNNPAEVKKLKEFLKNREGYADIIISDEYDEKTYSYVKKFQTNYLKDVLLPWGTTSPSGYVYKTTLKKINELYCSCGNYLKEYIKLGAKNNPSEVRKLQSFLSKYEGNNEITISGIYDEITYNAVKNFQSKHAKDVLLPWEMKNPSGYVYITTKQKINDLYCKYIK